MPDVGQLVLDALLDAGLDAEWNGDPRRAVTVSGITWRKRRPKPALGEGGVQA